VDRCAWLTIRAYGRAVVRQHLLLDVTGRHHVPAHGPVILAARHMHHLYDACALLSIVPRPLHLLVALDWARSPVQRYLLKAATDLARWPAVIRPESFELNAAMQYQPVDRLPQLRRATRLSLVLLEQGRALLVFPEGFPIVDPWPTPERGEADLLPFHRGCVDLAWMAGQRAGTTVPIVPAGLHYEDELKTRLTVRFGAPLIVRRREDRSELLRVLERQVAELSRP
jgi:putative membrane protein